LAAPAKELRTRDARKTTVPFPVAVERSDSGPMGINTPVARCRLRATRFASWVESFRDFEIDFFRPVMPIPHFKHNRDADNCNRQGFANATTQARHQASHLLAFSIKRRERLSIVKVVQQQIVLPPARPLARDNRCTTQPSTNAVMTQSPLVRRSPNAGWQRELKK